MYAEIDSLASVFREVSGFSRDARGLESRNRTAIRGDERRVLGCRRAPLQRCHRRAPVESAPPMRGNPRPPIAAVALLLLAACRGGEAPAPGPADVPTRPVVLIGWDGADWEVAEPLLAAGRMPHLEALRRRGALTELRSPAPRLSPLLWTTIATGRPPEIHGVLDFLEPDPDGGPLRPISRASRRSVALWEMATAARRSCGVVGWWATHPAQELDGGFMVSDALASALPASLAQATAADLDTAVLPAALQAAARSARVAPEDVPEAEMARLLAPGPADPELEARLRSIVAATLSYQRVTLAAARSGQPELLLVYYQGIDEVSHLLAHCTAPALPTCPAGRAGRGGETVAAFYVLQDRLLGELLEALAPESTVMLLSDHGFLSGARRPRHRAPDVAAEPGRWHRDAGIFVLAGPEVRPAQVAPVEIDEIAPTVLWLLGLPVAENFTGRPRQDLLLPARAAARPVASIPDWDAVASIPKVLPRSQVSAAEQARIEALRALGYVSSASTTVSEAGGRTVAAEVNLAWRWIQTRRLEEAKVAAGAATRRAPEYPPAWIALGEAHAAGRERVEAAAAFGKALHLLGAGADPDLLIRWAAVAGADPDRDLVAMIARAEAGGSAPASTAHGLLLLAAGATGRAETALREALQRDPAQVEALAALFESARRRGAEATLEPQLRRALAADSGGVLPRNWLALAREKQGDVAEAERLLREAAALAPRHAGTRINLGALLGRSGRSEEAERTFQEALLLAPEAVEARVGLAVLLSRGARLAEARQILEAAAPAVRNDPRLLNTLALVYRDLGLRQESAATLRASLAADRDQPGTAALLRALEEAR